MSYGAPRILVFIETRPPECCFIKQYQEIIKLHVLEVDKSFAMHRTKQVTRVGLSDFMHVTYKVEGNKDGITTNI